MAALGDQMSKNIYQELSSRKPRTVWANNKQERELPKTLPKKINKSNNSIKEKRLLH